MFRKALLVPVLLLALSATVCAQVAIEGPTEVQAGAKPARLNITGIKVTDLMTGGGKVSVYPRDAELWDAASWGGDPYLLFFTTKPGKYLVVVAFVQKGQLIWLEHEITAKGVPGPDPPIPPVPPVPGDRFILVVHETGERLPEQVLTLEGLAKYAESKKHPWRFEDQNLKDGVTGKTPVWFQSYVDRVKEVKVALPALVVIGKDKSGAFNQVVGLEALGKTAEAAVAQVKKYGG
jgi:hypothetical protein